MSGETLVIHCESKPRDSFTNQGVILTGDRFRKGVQLPIGVPGGRGLGSGSGAWWGVVCLWETREKGRGWGGWGADEVGTGKATGKSMKRSMRRFGGVMMASVGMVQTTVALLPCYMKWGHYDSVGMKLMFRDL